MAIKQKVSVVLGSAQGDLVVKGSGASFVTLTPGTSGQVLTSQGPGSDLTWTTLVGTDQLVKADAADPTPGYLDAKVDDASIEVDATAHQLRLKDAGIATAKLQDDSVTAAKLNANTAGLGLIQAVDGSLEVNEDDSTLELNGDVLQVKALGITSGELAAQAVLAAKLGNDVAGNGLTGGSGSALAVEAEDSTISVGASGIKVGANSIGAAQIDETDTYDFSSGSVVVAVPDASNKAATKGYVDGLVQGLDDKGSVRVATTAAGTLASDFENGDVIDGITLATGNLILIKNQASGIENGIYEVQASGAPVRVANMAATSSAASAYTWVEEGTDNADTGWHCTNDQGSDVVGTDVLVFSQFSGAGQITVGAGMTKDGNIINVIAADSSLTINADNMGVAINSGTMEINSGINVKNLGIDTAQLAAGAATVAKIDIDANLTFNENQALDFVLENRTTAPATPATGRIWIDDDGEIYYEDGL